MLINPFFQKIIEPMEKNELLVVKLSPELIKSIEPELFAKDELRLRLRIDFTDIRILDLSERLLKALLKRKNASIDELLTELGISSKELEMTIELLRKLRILI